MGPHLLSGTLNRRRLNPIKPAYNLSRPHGWLY